MSWYSSHVPFFSIYIYGAYPRRIALLTYSRLNDVIVALPSAIRIRNTPDAIMYYCQIFQSWNKELRQKYIQRIPGAYPKTFG